MRLCLIFFNFSYMRAWKLCTSNVRYIWPIKKVNTGQRTNQQNVYCEFDNSCHGVSFRINTVCLSFVICKHFAHRWPSGIHQIRLIFNSIREKYVVFVSCATINIFSTFDFQMHFDFQITSAIPVNFNLQK